MRQQPSFPGFFLAKLYVNSSPKDTFVKLPVSPTPSGVLNSVEPQNCRLKNMMLNLFSVFVDEMKIQIQSDLLHFMSYFWLTVIGYFYNNNFHLIFKALLKMFSWWFLCVKAIIKWIN